MALSLDEEYGLGGKHDYSCLISRILTEALSNNSLHACPSYFKYASFGHLISVFNTTADELTENYIIVIPALQKSSLGSVKV